MQFRSWALALVLFVFTVGSVVAQTSKGILTGTVRDATGAAIPNASVTATNLDTNEVRIQKTTSSGGYRLDALGPGRYKLHVQLDGFDAFDLTDLEVKPSIVTTYDPLMRVGGVSTAVEVQATGNLLETETGSLSATIGQADLKALPIFTQNPIELATTVPGVQTVSDSNGFSNGVNIQVNGARPRANNYLIDGQQINDTGLGGQAVQPEIPDAIQDVVVLTNSSSAEYGLAGGAVVNLITKPGTNRFHGSAYELYTGSGLNAKDGQSRQDTTTPKTRYNEHQIGFSVGGPIIRNKLFAFGAGQWSRYYGQEQALNAVLPDAAGFAVIKSIPGANSQLLQQLLYNGDYLNTFTRFGSQGIQESLNVNTPNGPQTVTTQVFRRPSVAQQNPDTQWIYRIDFTPHQQDSFTFRYLHDRQSLTPDFFANGSALPGFDTFQGGPSELGAGSWTHLFSSTLVNELRAAETRLNFGFDPTAETLANPLYTVPLLNFTNDDGNIPTLGFDSGGFPQGRAQESYQVQDTLSFTKGRHTLRIGADVGRVIETDTIGQNTKGTLTPAAGNGLSALGQFLANNLGPSGTATRAFGPTRIDPHKWRTSIFGQDDIKLSPELTVNLGLRWDYTTNPDNSLQFPSVDVSNNTALFGPIQTVYKVKNDFNNFGPRFGFAYAPSKLGGQTVIRGGFSMFYDTEFTNITTNTAQSSPNSVSGVRISTTGDGLSDPLGQIALITPEVSQFDSVQSVDRNLVNPYTYQYNVTIERALPGNVKASVGYVGSKGLKLFSNRQYNYFDATTQERLNPDRGQINLRGNYAASEYDSLQAEVSRAFTKGFLVRGTYTYGKTLSDADEVFTLSGNTTSYSADLSRTGLRQDWSNSGYDHRHYVSIAYVWSPIGLRADGALTNAVLGAFTRNWTISGITQFQSGSYSTFTTGHDLNGDGSAANDRPVQVNKSAPFSAVGVDGTYLADDTTPAVAGTYYDQAFYNQQKIAGASGADLLRQVDPSQQHFLIFKGQQYLSQEIGRNSFKNPGTQTWNLAVQKDFPATYFHLEQARIQFRVEAQNVGNHNNVGQLGTALNNVGTSSFMNPSVARSSTDYRLLRLFARVQF